MTQKSQLIEGNPVVDAALLRTQRFADEAQKVRMRLEAQGKNPRKSKQVTAADAEYSGALTVLAHILGAAGADVLVDGLPSHTLTGLYLEEWDRQRHAEAFRRATRGDAP
jgi:hypothetical protein